MRARVGFAAALNSRPRPAEPAGGLAALAPGPAAPPPPFGRRLRPGPRLAARARRSGAGCPPRLAAAAARGPAARPLRRLARRPRGAGAPVGLRSGRAPIRSPSLRSALPLCAPAPPWGPPFRPRRFAAAARSALALAPPPAGAAGLAPLAPWRRRRPAGVFCLGRFAALFFSNQIPASFPSAPPLRFKFKVRKSIDHRQDHAAMVQGLFHPFNVSILPH